jgi:hypothetical protein
MKSITNHAMKSFPQIKIQFMADVEYGVPTANAKCKNFGVCRIVPKQHSQPFKGCNGARSEALITVFGREKVVFDFLRSSISEEVYNQYFSRGLFLVEKDYHTPPFFEDYYPFTIKKGEYQIYETSSMVKIVFG